MLTSVSPAITPPPPKQQQVLPTPLMLSESPSSGESIHLLFFDPEWSIGVCMSVGKVVY